MNRWGKNSLKHRETLSSELIFLFDRVLQAHDCSIICGHRNQADQNAAFDRGASKLRWPKGKHNVLPSIAVDVAPYVAEVKIDGSNPKHLKYFYKFSGIVIGIAWELHETGAMVHRLRWGGDWDSDKNMDDQTFNDLYHFGLIL